MSFIKHTIKSHVDNMVEDLEKQGLFIASNQREFDDLVESLTGLLLQVLDEGEAPPVVEAIE